MRISFEILQVTSYYSKAKNYVIRPLERNGDMRLLLYGALTSYSKLMRNNLHLLIKLATFQYLVANIYIEI